MTTMGLFMHNDYKTRLTALSDKLTDVVLDEADPDTWPGADKPLDKHTKQERGDRYWCKKNAAASLTLLVKVHSLIGMHARRHAERRRRAGRRGVSPWAAGIRR